MHSKDDDEGIASQLRVNTTLEMLCNLVGLTNMGIRAKDIAYVFSAHRPDGSVIAEVCDGDRGLLAWEKDMIQPLLEVIPPEEASGAAAIEPMKITFQNPMQAFDRLTTCIERASSHGGPVSYAGAVRAVTGDGEDGKDPTGGLMLFGHHQGQHSATVRRWLESRMYLAQPEMLN